MSQSLESKVSSIVAMNPADRESALCGANAMVRRMVADRLASTLEQSPVVASPSPVDPVQSAALPASPAGIDPAALAPMVQQMLFQMLGQVSPGVPAVQPAVQPAAASPAKSAKPSKPSKAKPSKPQAAKAAPFAQGVSISLGEFQGHSTFVVRDNAKPADKAPAFCCGRSKALALLLALESDPAGVRRYLATVANVQR